MRGFSFVQRRPAGGPPAYVVAPLVQAAATGPPDRRRRQQQTLAVGTTQWPEPPQHSRLRNPPARAAHRMRMMNCEE
jgi:hypothetical protein